MTPKNLPLALLIMRLATGSFLMVWASLKFYRSEWMVNVFKNRYGLDFVTADYAYFVGSAQLLIVLLFLVGFKRRWVYGFVVLMHAAGVVASIPSLIDYTKYPNNLLWTSVATLGGLIALFLLREADRFTLDHWLKRRNDAGNKDPHPHSQAG